MENKMAEVAKLLGVELNSEFTLKDSSFTYRLTEQGLDSKYPNDYKWYPSGMLEDLLTGTYNIIQRTRPILDDDERKYLSAVIKPFRDKVVVVRKFISPNSEKLEYIRISYRDGFKINALNFPDFKAGTMYRGMKIGKPYKLEELGL